MATKETPNLRNVMSFVANRATPMPTPEEAAPTAASTELNTPESEATPAATVSPAPPRKSTEAERRTKPKKQRATADEPAEHADYTEAFLVPVRGRKPKTIYVDEDTHEALSVITQSVEGVGLSDLIINIVNHHFETYGKDIRSFLDSIENQKKKRLPY